MEDKKTMLEANNIDVFYGDFQAIKDVSNASINIAFESIEKLMLNSLDKSKLDKIFNKSLEETKLALQKKSS